MTARRGRQVRLQGRPGSRSFAAAAAALSVAWAGCSAERTAVFSRTEYVMGTLLEVRVEARDSLLARRAVDSAFAVVRRLDRLLSNYDSSSEITAIKRRAPEAVPVSEATFAFVERALALARLTGGAVDPTIEPLVRAWGFFGDEPARPDSETLARALAHVDYRGVQLDPAARTVRVRPGMALDPGATGKGFALGEAARAVAPMKLEGVHFDFGGQLFRHGKRPSLNAVRHPRADSLIAAIEFASGSLATTGDYERFFVADGERYAHILDPSTGMPVTGRHSVSVYATDPFDADGLATALFVLGPERGRELLRRFPRAAALFIESDRDGLRLVATPAWTAMERR